MAGERDESLPGADPMPPDYTTIDAGWREDLVTAFGEKRVARWEARQRELAQALVDDPPDDMDQMMRDWIFRTLGWEPDTDEERMA